MSLSRRRLMLGGSVLLGSGVLSACSDQETAAPSSSSSGASTSSGAASSSASPSVAAPTFPEIRTTPLPAGAKTAWKDVSKVPHLFFHSLVVDPERAFVAKDDWDGYLDYMVTLDEFTAILPQLWSNGYVLVSPHELYEVGEDDVVRPKELLVPQNRTPLIISLDDCSYYRYMEGDGFASRLILDEDGRVRNEYTDAEGNTTVGAYDVPTVLDDFIDEHPDFSLNGARGVFALTGYDGVFGYRTSEDQDGDSETFDDDVAMATKVAEALAATGWEFASHTWGHRHVPELEMDELRTDLGLWHAEVEPIIGATDMLIYPFGDDIAGTETYEGERYEYLRDELGYRSFFLVDGTAKAWGQLEPGYYRGSRINVDGISLSRNMDGTGPVLSEFFNTPSVLDPARPESIRAVGAGEAYPPGGESGSPSSSAASSSG